MTVGDLKAIREVLREKAGCCRGDGHNGRAAVHIHYCAGERAGRQSWSIPAWHQQRAVGVLARVLALQAPLCLSTHNCSKTGSGSRTLCTPTHSTL